MEITKNCNLCNTEHSVIVKTSEYNRWATGTPIQNAMPSVSADDRELLISGTCGTCFDKLFGGGDE